MENGLVGSLSIPSQVNPDHLFLIIVVSSDAAGIGESASWLGRRDYRLVEEGEAYSCRTSLKLQMKQDRDGVLLVFHPDS